MREPDLTIPRFQGTLLDADPESRSRSQRGAARHPARYWPGSAGSEMSAGLSTCRDAQGRRSSVRIAVGALAALPSYPSLLIGVSLMQEISAVVAPSDASQTRPRHLLAGGAPIEGMRRRGSNIDGWCQSHLLPRLSEATLTPHRWAGYRSETWPGPVRSRYLVHRNSSGEAMNTASSEPQKRWIEGADRRHAIDGLPVHPGDEVITLCEREIVVVTPTPRQPAPECRVCDHVWRELDGIPQRETYVPQPASESTVRELAQQLSYRDELAISGGDDSTIRLQLALAPEKSSE